MSCLRGSVGEGGNNIPKDVKYVQFLLCDWRYCIGGVGIVVDGRAGPLTKSAIKEFQSKYTGIVDSRVDPSGPAIQAMENMHVNNLAKGVIASAIEYFYLRSALPAQGPLSWEGVAARYFGALYDSFK